MLSIQFSKNPAKTLLQTSMVGTIGFLAIGLQPASAIVLSVGGTTLADTDYGCNNLTSNILDCYGFNNFDDSSKWLTASDGGKWAIRGTIIAASGTLSTSVTGEGTGARILTFTNATFQYKGGATTGSTSTFSGINFSHNFDFTTTTRSGPALFTNPTVSHRLSGKLDSPDGLDARNQVISTVSFNGTARIGTTTNPETAISFSDALLTDSLAPSGAPSGTTFNFFSTQDQSMASLTGNGTSALYLKSGTIASRVNSVVLAQGDTLYLPASECTVIYEPKHKSKNKGNNGLGNGVDPQPPGDPKPNDTEERVAEHNLKRNSQGSGGNPHNENNTINKDSDSVERLCNQIARSVIGDDSESVPEPNSAVPVVGGLLLWGAGSLIRKLKP